MGDRKYRQRGYQDEERPARESRAERQPNAPGSRVPEGPRTPNMPGFHDVIRCARCGQLLEPPIGAETRCNRCGTDLHSCGQCTWFDSGSRFECGQPIPARITPKDARNDCSFFEVRRTVERETGSAGPSDTKRAFDDLFK